MQMICPRYHDLCFSNLPGLFERLLFGETKRPTIPEELLPRGLSTYDHVIFVFFDALGWESLERIRDKSELFKRGDGLGSLLKTTSQFPSTTAVHVTTFFSGLPAYRHSICGWDYFEPFLGRMIKPLKFCFTEDTERETLSLLGITGNDFLPEGDFFQNLKAKSCDVTVHGPRAYFPSSFSLAYLHQHDFYGYESLAHGVESIAQNADRSARGFHSLYLEDYDVVCHQHGVGSEHADQVLHMLLNQIEQLLTKRFTKKTVLVLSSDHGHISRKKDGLIKINEVVPELPQLLKKDNRGQPIRYSGGDRYLFLHPEESNYQYALTTVRERLRGAAWVGGLSDMKELGLLGDRDLTPEMASRFGTLAVLPEPEYSISWFEPPHFKPGHISEHGGVSPQEMETPLLILPLS